MKKFISLIIAALMAWSVIPSVSASDDINLVPNNGFEILNASGVPTEWRFSGKFGEGFEIASDAHGGKNAFIMKSAEGASIFTAFVVSDIIAGEKYKVSGFVKLPDGTDGFAAKAEFRGASAPVSGDVGFSFAELSKGNRWQEFGFEFQAPEEALSVTVLIRSLQGKEVHLDDIVMTGKTVPPVQTCEFIDTIEGTPGLIANGDFEKLSADGGAEGWKAHGNTWNGLASITKEEGRGNVLKLNDAGSSNPWGMYLIKDLSQGAKYQVTAWIKTITISGSIRLKLEFYSNNQNTAETFISQTGSSVFVPTKGAWQQVAFSFEVPVGADCMALYCRMYGAGEAYYDDVQCKLAAKAPMLFVGSDAFIYSDWEEAQAYAEFNDVVYDMAEGGLTTFELMDGEKVLDSAAALSSSYCTYKFKTSLLTEKKKEYTIRISYCDASGNVLESYDEPVYKYDRPTRLTKSGEFITEDGSTIIPSFGYHVTQTDFARCAELGINVVQLYAAGTPAQVLASLDKLREAGIYGALNLYVGMKPAGDDSNVKHTIEVVNAVKNHPALYGYMTMDEPFINDPTCYEALRKSYKVFRDLDDEHPVFICECERIWLYKTITVCDVLAIDPYPTAARLHETHVSDFSRTATAVNTHGKPVYNILQALKLGGWEPESVDMRHMAYQAFFAGNSLIGYYPISDSDSIVWDSPFYLGVKNFLGDEYKDAFKAFVTGQYPTFSELSNDRNSVWHKAYIKDGELYIVLINRTQSQQTAKIPLISGGISIGEFKAVSADMETREEISGSGVFEVTLKASDAARYKIVTGEKLDASGLTNDVYSDIASYNWANTDINKLASLGIVNSFGTEYRPGTNITRGDFAMFLIRTLGLAADAKDNFADVDSSAVYAKEIAVGRVLGILKGTDGVNFNPEAFITRQDLMTIIARGLELSGSEADLTAFKDSGLIADYALASISAMVGSGLVKGNADGSINPLGNATRAEAAVIMSRILDKNDIADVKRSDDAVPLEMLYKD